MNKKRLALIIVLVCLIALYLVMRSYRPDEKLYPIYDIDSLAIAKIVVYDQADTLKLEKQKGKWMLVEPVKWEADTLRISTLFKDVFDQKYPKTPMGTGEDAVSRYKLNDNQALHIIVSDARGKKSIHTMFSNMGNPFDYFRYAGSNQVYQIKNKVMTVYNTELPMWRSPHVVNVKESDLSSIEVTHINNSYTLTKQQMDWVYSDKMEHFTIPRTNIAIAKVLTILANFDTYVFVDGGTNDQLAKFKDPVCTVVLHFTNGGTQNLKFVKQDDSNYLMMVDNDPSVLFIVTFDSVFRFMRHAAVFAERSMGE